MDFKSILNDEDGVADRPPRHSSASRSSLPALNTKSSPNQPPHYPPAAQYAASPHGHPYQMTPTSAYASYPPPMQTSGYGAPPPPADLHRHVSHPSPATTPSSHPQTPYGFQRSPSASRSHSHQALPYSHPPHHPMTGTPTGVHVYLSPSTYHRPSPGEPHAQYQQPTMTHTYAPPPRLASQGSRDNSIHSLLNDRGPGVSISAASSAMSPPAPPGSTLHSMHAQHARPQMSRHGSSMASSRERTRSISVSPKTMVTALPGSRSGSMTGTPAAPSSDGADAHFIRPSSVKARTSSVTSSFLKDPTPQDKRRTPQHLDVSFLSSPLAPAQRDVPMPAAPEINVPKGSKRSFEEQDASTDFIEPRPKKRRGVEIPIWAQMCKSSAPLPKYRNAVQARQSNLLATAPVQASERSPIPQSAVVRLDHDLHAKLEDSFIGIMPFSDIHKSLCDFVFHNVVQNNTFGTTRAGEAASSHMGELEIEAKIGTIIDRNTNDRLRMQAASEVVLPHGTNITFESMMTEEQHAHYNKMLNDAVVRSLGHGAASGAKPRAKIDYVHRHEVDSFYPLPPAELHGLPPAIIPLATQGGRQSKVRVTKDQKTGDIIAQIVKVRIAELNVHSPLTPFDWRITISAEAKWDGDVKFLMAAVAGGARNKAQPDRIKDRVSYKHQYCQIDLTQVKPVAGVGNDKATHELEVELDAAIVREQGRLNMEGKANMFEAVVKTLLNNVRLLTRGKF